jgi:hypothetical protein
VAGRSAAVFQPYEPYAHYRFFKERNGG